MATIKDRELIKTDVRIDLLIGRSIFYIKFLYKKFNKITIELGLLLPHYCFEKYKEDKKDYK